MAGGIEKSGQGQNVTLSLITKRNLDPTLQRDTEEAMRRSLSRLSTVRLDREQITSLSNLECVPGIHSLYLQQNLIKKIENLDGLKNLRFLSLAGNRIAEAANLSTLQSLKFLDLSHNLIKSITAGEFPPGLLILDLTGNPCRQRSGYRQEVLRALPNLQELDQESVYRRSSPDSLSDPAQEEESDSDADDISPGLGSVSQEMLQRSQLRRDRALKEHRDRLEELGDTREMLEGIRSAGGDPCSPHSCQMSQCTESAQSLHRSKEQPQITGPKSATTSEDAKSQCQILPGNNPQPPATSQTGKIQPQSLSRCTKSQTSHSKPSSKPKTVTTQAASRGPGPTEARPQVDPSVLSRGLQHTAPNIRKAPGTAAHLSGVSNGKRAVSAPSKNIKPVNTTVRSQTAEKTHTAAHKAPASAQNSSRK